MKKRYTLTLDEHIVKQAKKKAIDENTNFSALVEKLLKEHIANNQIPLSNHSIP